MVRRFLPLLLVLAGCGGGSDERGAISLSPYGYVAFAADDGYDGPTEPTTFLVGRTDLVSGDLVVESQDLNAPNVTLGFVLRGYAAKTRVRYGLGQGEFGNGLRLTATPEGGSPKAWEATGGEIVDRGWVSQGYRRELRLVGVTLSPVEGTGATGTATLSGDFDVDFPGGRSRP